MTVVTLTTLRIVAVVAFLLVAGGLASYVLRRRRVARLLGDPGVIRQIMGEDLHRIPWMRLVPVASAAALLALALLDPALPSRRVGGSGPVVLLLDASGSMLVEDVGGSRLELQRAIAQDFARAVPDLPIGVVAFAGRAFSLTPPTRDRTSVEMYLATLDPTIVTQTGSALGAAIRQGVSLLTADEESGGGSIILFGDGDETHDPDAALEAAELAGRSGIPIHVVAVGSSTGGPVPALDLTTGRAEGYLRNPGGEVEVSRLGESLLAGIARRSAGGIVVSASETDAGGLLAQQVRVADIAAATPTGRLPRYAWLAGAALLLLLVEPVADRRGRRT